MSNITVGFTLITEQGPLKNCTTLRTQTQPDTLNTYILLTYTINSRNQRTLMCCSKDFNVLNS